MYENEVTHVSKRAARPMTPIVSSAMLFLVLSDVDNTLIVICYI